MSNEPPPKTTSISLPIEQIDRKILVVRGHRVFLDFDLAALYGVETRVLIQAVARNQERFPADFMFRLTNQELDDWRSQFVMSNPKMKMGLRRPPYAFTEHGIAMLSSVLHSKQAISVNIEIMRAFVRLRQFMRTHKDLAKKLDDLEAKYDENFAVVFDAIRKLMEPAPMGKKRRIGYIIAADAERD